MSQIRFLTSSDEHLADLPPGFRKDDYRASILDKIAWQGGLAGRSLCDAIIRGGDFFHVKAANKTTHTTMQMVASLHKEFTCPTFALAGNHDMTNNDLSSVYRSQPLGVLFRTGVFRELNEQTFVNGTLKVRVVGVPYLTDLSVPDLTTRITKRQDDGYLIAVIHALASFAPDEKVQSFFNEPIIDYRDLVFPGCPDLYIFGHYHKDQGIVDHLGVKFINLGSISRGALTFENLERKPKSALVTITSSGVDAEEIILPHRDASDIFDLNLKRRLDTERRDLSDFIEKLKLNTNDDVLDRNNMLASYPDNLRSLALEILEAAESGVLEE